MSTKHPVGALKELIEMTPEEEARFREICDEPVLVCPTCNAGIIVEVNDKPSCVVCGQQWEATVLN